MHIPGPARLAELEAMGPEWAALRAAAHELDARLAATPWRTLCHGDFKAQNLLFTPSRAAAADSPAGWGCSTAGGAQQQQGQQQQRQQGQQQQQQQQQRQRRGQQQQQGPGAVRAAAFDFQYAGGGSGLRDVAKLFANSVQARLLEGGGEAALLRFYHEHLLDGLRALAAGGGGVGCPAAAARALEGYTFEALQDEFRLALADFARFCAGWQPRGFWGNPEWAAARSRRCLQELGLA